VTSSQAELVNEVLRAAPVFDGHNDLPWALREAGLSALDGVDLTNQPRFHTDLQRLRDGGVGAQWWSVYVPSTLPDDQAVAETMDQIDLVHRMVTQYPQYLALATTVDEAQAVVASGRIASLLGAEGGHSMGGELDGLDRLYERGVRYMTLTHNDNTSWADSATDTPRSGGLSDFGRDVVRRMNSLGIIVDLAHVAVATMNDALDTTTKPVLITHSSAQALTPHVRNVPDEVLARLHSNGGVCMVAFVAEFVNEAFRQWVHDRDREGPPPPVTVKDVADHIDHVREVAGVDHVGLGGDFDGCPELPDGLTDVSGYPRLVAELVDRGWSKADLRRLTGENALRVLADNTSNQRSSK
jgi:membrane dipeptidase